MTCAHTLRLCTHGLTEATNHRMWVPTVTVQHASDRCVTVTRHRRDKKSTKFWGNLLWRARVYIRGVYTDVSTTASTRSLPGFERNDMRSEPKGTVCHEYHLVVRWMLPGMSLNWHLRDPQDRRKGLRRASPATLSELRRPSGHEE